MLTFLEVAGLVYTVNDPEIRYTENKTAVASFTVAVNSNWTDEGGSKHEDSCFIDCVAWNKLAESIIKFGVSKGDPLYVKGLLKQERWESKEGQKHSKHVLTVIRIVFLKPKE